MLYPCGPPAGRCGVSGVTCHPLPQAIPPDGHPSPHTCTRAQHPLPPPPSPHSPHRIQGPLLHLSLHLQIWTQKGTLPSNVGKKPYICSTAADEEGTQPSVSSPLRRPSHGCALPRAASPAVATAGRAWTVEKRGVLWAGGKTQPQHTWHIFTRCSHPRATLQVPPGADTLLYFLTGEDIPRKEL